MRVRTLVGLSVWLVAAWSLLPGCDGGEPLPTEDCTNGLDDDGDGLVDDDDPACTGCSPSSPREEADGIDDEQCMNGVDDDCDGLIDCDEPACGSSPACPMEDCDNEVDDDGDGQVDCDDDDCDCPPTTATAQPASITAVHTVGVTACPQELDTLEITPDGWTATITSLPAGVSLETDAGPLDVGDSFSTDEMVRVVFTCDSTDDVSGEIVLEMVDDRLDPAGTLRVPVTVDVQTPTPSGPRTYPTIGAPEGLGIFVPNPAIFAPGGLVESRPYAVVTSAAGGADLIDLETGTRDTATFIPAAYGVSTHRDDGSAGPEEVFVFHGPTNVAYTYWDASGPTFGFTSLSSGSNVTDMDIGPLDGSGVPSAEMFVNNGGPFVSISRAGGGGSVILGDSFPGGSYPADPVSAAFSPDALSVMILLENGELWYGVPDSPLTLAGTAGTDMRLLECDRGTTVRVCAACDYAGDSVFVIELTNTGATIIDSAAGGDGPVEPAVIADGSNVIVASTGSNDGSLTLLRYDPAADTLSSLGSTTLTDCTGPAHSRFITPDDLVVSCNGSDSLVRLDPFEAVGATR